MAVYYLSSVNGNDGDGLSKANAKTTYAAAIALLSAGDTIRIDSAHSESIAAGQILTFPSNTNAAPNKVISIDWTPDTYLRAPNSQFTITDSGADIQIVGTVLHYGVYYTAADDILVITPGNLNEFTDSTLSLTGTASLFKVGSNNGGVTVKLFDTELIFVSGGDGIQPNGTLHFEWHNGPNNRSKLTQTGTIMSWLFREVMRSAVVKISGVDLSVVSSVIFRGAGGDTGWAEFSAKNCLLHASVSLTAGITQVQNNASMVGCDVAGGDLYRTEIADFYGTTVTDNANYNDTGASDGTNRISWKMVSSDKALEFHLPHKSHWISGWINSTGSKTFLIETNSENVTFDNDELWMELEFLEASGDTQSDAANGKPTNVDTAPSVVPDSAANPTWTTPGITTEKKQQLSITKTVGRVGTFRARVCLAKPSATVWIDPFVTVS